MLWSEVRYGVFTLGGWLASEMRIRRSHVWQSSSLGIKLAAVSCASPRRYCGIRSAVDEGVLRAQATSMKDVSKAQPGFADASRMAGLDAIVEYERDGVLKRHRTVNHGYGTVSMGIGGRAPRASIQGPCRSPFGLRFSLLGADL